MHTHLVIVRLDADLIEIETRLPHCSCADLGAAIERRTDSLLLGLGALRSR